MHPILKAYIPVADIIVGTFGNQCEVVLHDLSVPVGSVVYVANGTVTNRKVGQSFDHLVKQVLLNKNFRDDMVINYLFDTPDGRIIKSSSALIRDENSDVVGMMCINVDISLYQQLQDQLNLFIHSDAQDVASSDEDLDQNVLDIIDELISKIIGTADVKNLTRKRCVEIIKFMDEKGIFLVKGTIDKVADIMGVSKVTIYSYLDEAKGKR